MHRAAVALSFILSCAPDAVLVPVEERPACTEEYSDIPLGECDLYRQDCDDPGDNCVPYSDGASYSTQCSAQFGGKQAGESCISTAECDSGMICGLGSCSPVCCPSNDAPCGDDGRCIARESLGDFVVRRCAYLQPCELFTSDACDGQNRCQITQQLGVSLCVPPAAAQGEGQPCDAPNDCADAQMCYAPVGPIGSCRFNCLFAARGDEPGFGGCPNGQTCTPFGYPDATIGVCLP